MGNIFLPILLSLSPEITMVYKNYFFNQNLKKISERERLNINKNRNK